MLKTLLNKGGAGKSLARAETADRLSDLLRLFNELMYAYESAIRVGGTEEITRALQSSAYIVRADIGKISELVLSSGGYPPLGTDIEPESIDVGNTTSEALAHVIEREAAFTERLKGESRIRHRRRTIATVDNTLANTKRRLEQLRALSQSV